MGAAPHPPCTDCGDRPARSARPRTASGARCNRCHLRVLAGGAAPTPAPAFVPAALPGAACKRRHMRRARAAARIDAWLPPLERFAAHLARAQRGACARAALGADDLAQLGAAAYLADQAKDGARWTHPRALAAAKGAMLEALRAAPRAEDVHVPVRDALDCAPDRAPFVPPAALPRRPGRTGLAALPRRVRRAVGRLTPAQQQVVRLTLQGRGPQEIAAVVGCSENAANLRKHHALAALRGRLCPQLGVTAPVGSTNHEAICFGGRTGVAPAAVAVPLPRAA